MRILESPMKMGLLTMRIFGSPKRILGSPSEDIEVSDENSGVSDDIGSQLSLQ